MSSSKSGCGMSAFFVVIFIASVALNGVLLSGCVAPEKCPLCGRDKRGQSSMQSSTVYDAANDLQEIASRLGIETEGRDACETASQIKTHLCIEPSAKGFPRELLTEQQLEGVRDLIPEKMNATIAEYQRFIKSLEGKRFIVIP